MREAVESERAAKRVDLVVEACLGVWVFGEKRERPRERDGGRLVAGEQERQRLVADLDVRHRRARVFVAGVEKH